jgi:hypothetical protein
LLRADFTYQETTQMTGGALLDMMKLAGPFARQAREPNVSTHIVKGDRMVSLRKDRATVIDLDKESITEIDFAKKTYSVMTFAEMKQALENALQRGAASKNGDKVDADFKVSAKPTGQTKAVQGLTAKELVITMAIEATDKESGRSGAMTTVMDTWVAAVPGYEEVRAFQRKMGEKMGYLFGSGMAQMSMTRPEMAKGFAEAAKELAKLDGVPVQTILKISGAGDGQQADSQASQRQSNSSGLGALGGIGGLGRFGRKKNQEQAPASDQQAQGSASTGSLIETTTELASFSSGPADTSKFEVPAGFKQVESEMGRRRR